MTKDSSAPCMARSPRGSGVTEKSRLAQYAASGSVTVLDMVTAQFQNCSYNPYVYSLTAADKVRSREDCHRWDTWPCHCLIPCKATRRRKIASQFHLLLS